ncbi:MAG: hypothetical protein H0U89_00980 [Acidimicrobiia bacterium]|nr:hypothetical protein [Acidimicrobiia bacterium]
MSDTTPARPDEARRPPPDPADWSKATEEEVRQQQDWFVETFNRLAGRCQLKAEDNAHGVNELRHMAKTVSQWTVEEAREVLTELRPTADGVVDIVRTRGIEVVDDRNRPRLTLGFLDYDEDTYGLNLLDRHGRQFAWLLLGTDGAQFGLSNGENVVLNADVALNDGRNFRPGVRLALADENGTAALELGVAADGTVWGPTPFGSGTKEGTEPTAMQERIDAGWSATDVLAAGPLARDRAPAPDDRASKQARVRPEWISTEGMGIPQDLLAEVADVTQRARALVPDLQAVTTRAEELFAQAEACLTAQEGLGGELPLEVWDAAWSTIGTRQLGDVLKLLSALAGHHLEGSQGPDLDEMRDQFADLLSGAPRS